MLPLLSYLDIVRLFAFFLYLGIVTLSGTMYWYPKDPPENHMPE